MLKHQRTERCNDNEQMRGRRRDFAIASLWAGESFSPRGEYGAECVGVGVGMLTYLWRPLEKSDNEWTEVCRNIRKARQVWGRIRKILRREGADPFVLDIFYRAVVQEVLLFWVSHMGALDGDV